MSYLSDLFTIMRTGGIALDKGECDALGGPEGKTISVWMAMSARHGDALAHVACVALYVVQVHHCRDQLAGVPMQANNYFRAGVGLVALAPVVGAVWLGRQAVRGVKVVGA